MRKNHPKINSILKKHLSLKSNKYIALIGRFWIMCTTLILENVIYGRQYLTFGFCNNLFYVNVCMCARALASLFFFSDGISPLLYFLFRLGSSVFVSPTIPFSCSLIYERFVSYSIMQNKLVILNFLRCLSTIQLFYNAVVM